MLRQQRKPSDTGIFHVMMRGINHQNIFEDEEDNYQFTEPVNDMAYFTVLLRYIHQNPVKAGIVERVKDYEYSSWSEFDGTVEPVFQICDTRTVLNRIPFKDLEEWVNDPLDDDVNCLDNDNEKPRYRLSDDQVWQQIIKLIGVTNSSDFQKLNKDKQRETLRTLLDIGASVRQLHLCD